VDVAAHLAQHNDFAGGDIGCDLAIAADGDAVARKVDGAFDLAVDVERLRSRDLALDDEGLADGGLLAGLGTGQRRASGRSRGAGSKADGVEAGGAGRAGSGVEGEVGPVWFGFHMIRLFPFLVA
jgi:hypothetical protein